MRCFIGIPLPDSYQKIMAELIENWKNRLNSKITWTRFGNWHLTLYFFFNLDQEQLKNIESALAEVKMEKFAFQSKGGGFFPGPKKPRVIWVGLQKGADKSSELASRVLSSLQPLGYEPDKRPFAAHLTLGRIKQARQDNWGELLYYLNNLDWPEINIDKFVLWKSELSQKGPTYTVLQEYHLQKGNE